MTSEFTDWTVLERLSRVITTRAGGDGATSYVAGLIAEGPRKCAEKVGEEAVETALATMAGNRDEMVSESADLLFHLMVLWEATGIRPADVLAELARREGVSGLAEKAGRKR